MKPLISWDAPEHHHIEKNNDWYWSVGIITITAVALCIIFNNIIFGILLLTCSFALVVHAYKKPEIIHCGINDRGIVVGETLYPFLSLESFWIDAHMRPSKIILKSHKLFMPFIIIYIEGIDPEDVREILLNYISETEHHEPISQKLLEMLGF